MKQRLKRIVCFILTLALIVPILSSQGLGKVNAKSYFLPETPENSSYLVGKDIKAGRYVVFSDNTSSLGAFWEINNNSGNKVIDNEFTKVATVITVKQSQRLVIHRGYAIPINSVSNSVFRFYNLAEVPLLQSACISNH
jgi:hypothetical protein